MMQQPYLALHMERMAYLEAQPDCDVKYRRRLALDPKTVHRCVRHQCHMLCSPVDSALFVCAASGNVHRCGPDCQDIQVLRDQSRVCNLVGMFYGYELQEENPLVSPRFATARTQEDSLKASAAERLSIGSGSMESLRSVVLQYETQAAAIVRQFLFSKEREAHELSRVYSSHAKLSPLIYRMVALESMDGVRPVTPLLNVVMLILGEATRLRARNLLPRISEPDRALIIQRVAKLSARLFVAFEQADKTKSQSPPPTSGGSAAGKKKDPAYPFVYHVVSVMYCTASVSGVRDTNGRLLLLPVPLLDKVIPPEEDLNHLNLEKRIFSRTEVMFRKKLAQLYSVK